MHEFGSDAVDGYRHVSAMDVVLLRAHPGVWIYGEAFAASRLSMMRIVARRMNAATVVA